MKFSPMVAVIVKSIKILIIKEKSEAGLFQPGVLQSAGRGLDSTRVLMQQAKVTKQRRRGLRVLHETVVDTTNPGI